MAEKKRKKRTTKTGKLRDIMLTMRISATELKILDDLCSKRKICGSPRWSRTDVLIDAIRFADGQLSSILS